MKKLARIGVIGGSGLYEMEGAKVTGEHLPHTPWGEPSDKITIADVGGKSIAFLPRHARGHTLLPSEVNSRANIAALKSLGVEIILAFSAVGSLKEEIAPLDFVLPGQLIDRTKGRESTFFGEGVVGHVSFADPFCGRMEKQVAAAAGKLGIKIHRGETLVCMEGPAFSTRAESHLYRSWGAGCINMSTLPEAKLAREAELCYQVVCMATDYDCWREGEEHVSVEMLLSNLAKNAEHARKVVREALSVLDTRRDCPCPAAARSAIVTDPAQRSPDASAKLKFLFPDWDA